MLIDTHCHLDAHEFADDRRALVHAAHQAGVSAMIIPSVEAGNFSAVRDCCTTYAACFPAYGIHPLSLDRASEVDLITLRQWLKTESAGALAPVAVGEIGLDFYMPGFDAARQEHFFIEQLRIAKDLDLPVLLHVRRSVDQVPMDSIVLETDAPDIPPVWLSGERNTPVELVRIARTLSDLRGISHEEVLKATSANVLSLLPRVLPSLSDSASPQVAG